MTLSIMHKARACIVLALFVAAPALAQVATLDDDELAVLAAAIEQTRLKGNEKWVMVEDDAATFQCGGATMINVGGCGGMRRKTQTIDEVMAWLQNQFPDASAMVLANFRTKTEFPATVHRPLPLKVPQVVWGRVGEKKKGVVAGGPLPKGNPDYLFNVSRVGFDPQHHEGLAYVAGVSWTDRERQYAEYVYLRNADGKWTVAKQVRVWHLGAGSPDARNPAPK